MGALQGFPIRISFLWNRRPEKSFFVFLTLKNSSIMEKSKIKFTQINDTFDKNYVNRPDLNNI